METMADLVLYTNPMSRGRIARWMLEEVGEPYEAIFVDYGPPMKGPEHLALNPMGKVPVLAHGDVVVTECAAICAYLADAFPGAGLAPDAGRRGAYYRWLFFAAGPLESAVTNLGLGVVVPEDKKGFVGYGSLEDVLGAIEGLLSERPYVAGDRFTAADVYLGAQIIWGMQFGTVPQRPAFEAYAARLKARPAAMRAQAADDAAVKGNGAQE
jgi:glutathione S-transferase